MRKICSECGQNKLLHLFRVRRLICKSCEGIQTGLRQQKHISRGLCRSGCGGEIVTGAWCLFHWVYKALFGQCRRGTPRPPSAERKKMSEVMVERLKSNPRCPVTGEKLVPGINCALDHIIPQSTNPELMHSLSNLQWTSIVYNSAKGTLEEGEFNKRYSLKSKDPNWAVRLAKARKKLGK